MSLKLNIWKNHEENYFNTNFDKVMAITWEDIKECY